MHLSLFAGHKVVARGAGVSDQRVKLALGVKDNPVGTGRSASVDLVRGQDRELVPRRCGREAESFVVVVLVRVATCKFDVSIPICQELGIPSCGRGFITYLVRCQTGSLSKPQPEPRQCPLAKENGNVSGNESLSCFFSESLPSSKLNHRCKHTHPALGGRRPQAQPRARRWELPPTRRRKRTEPRGTEI